MPALLKTLFKLFFSLLLPITAIGQVVPSVPAWIKDIGGAGSSSITTILKTDNQNNIYITGIYSGTVDFDPSPTGVKNLTSIGGSFDAYVAKYDTNGALIWAISLGGAGTDQPNGMDLDKNGNITITGQYDSPTLDADPSTGVFNLTNAGAKDLFIIHLDNNGNFLWAKTIGGIGIENGSKVISDAAGNLIEAAQFQATVTVGTTSYTAKGAIDGLLIKYDTNGNIIWSFSVGSVGGGDNSITGVLVDGNGNIDIDGYLNGTVNLNPLGTGPNIVANNAMYVAQYTPAGILTWVKSISNALPTNGANIALDAQNDVYLVASFSGTTIFGGAGTLNSKGTQDLLLAKYSSNGTLQWDKDVGGAGSSISNYGISSNNNNLYITGYFNGTIDFDPSAAVVNVKDHGIRDLFVAKYDANGNYQWALGEGNNTCNNTLGRYVTVDNNNDLLFTGSFCSTVNFDLSNCTTDNVTAQSNIRDIFIAKYSTAVIPSSNVITPPAVIAFCATGDPGIITGNIPTDGTVTYTYQWQRSTDNINFTNITGATLKDYDPPVIKVTTYYRRQVTSGICNVPVSSNVITITISVMPVISVSTATTICLGSSINLNASGGTTYQWTPAAGLSDANIANPVASPSATTTYTVTVTNGTCSATDTVTIAIVPLPIVNAGADKIILGGDNIQLNGTVTGNNVQYSWSPPTYLDDPNSLTPIASPPADITYTLTATSAQGCFVISDDIFIRVYAKILIPNTFTPNGDGINDTWDIATLNTYSACQVSVFNRYGAIVYKSIGYNKAWDGTYKGSMVPFGTYYYTIDLKDGTKTRSGWVTIVR